MGKRLTKLANGFKILNITRSNNTENIEDLQIVEMLTSRIRKPGLYTNTYLCVAAVTGAYYI